MEKAMPKAVAKTVEKAVEAQEKAVVKVATLTITIAPLTITMDFSQHVQLLNVRHICVTGDVLIVGELDICGVMLLVPLVETIICPERKLI